MMSEAKSLVQNVISGEWKDIAQLTREAIDAGMRAEEIILQLQAGMEIVGEKYSTGEYFLPDMMKSARCMNLAFEVLKPLMKGSVAGSLGRILIGTVKADMHDIGKNIVVVFLKGVGFEVTDLGTDVSEEKFCEEVRNLKPDILGLSSLLTTTMHEIGTVVKKLEDSGLRASVKVIAGGAPITEAFAKRMGADAYAADGGQAITICKQLIQGRNRNHGGSSEMPLTQKKRILDVVAGKQVDKLPFGARIDVWYNYHSAHDSLPAKYKGWSQTDIIADQGAAAQKRFFSVCKEEYHDMEVVKRQEPPYEVTEFITPIGTCSIKLLWSVAEGPWLAYEHEKLFKTEQDYPIVKYILEHTVPVFNEDYTKEREDMGDRGIVMTGTGLWCPAQRVMREIMGYERFYNEYMDRPEKIDEMMEAMSNLERKKLEICLTSDIEIINLCANWSDDIHTPVFRQYFTPWLREASEKIHAAGKFSMAHVDGEMRRLNPLYAETMLDIAEAITPVPQTKCTMTEFRAMGDKVTLWGGIPSIMFEPSFGEEEFDDYIKALFKEMAPGTRFIVGMGDNLPVAADINRIGRVVELIEKYGVLPIE